MKAFNLLLIITLCGCSFGNHTLTTSPFRDIVHVTKPNYPKKAFDGKIHGYALVKFDVDENGKTTNIYAHSTPDKLFEIVAREAVSKWRYKKGSPKKDIQVRLIFKING